MKITIDRSAILKSMGRVQSVVERRNTIPILANVLVQTGEGGLTLIATDLDIEIRETVAAEVAREGAVTVSAQTLHDILRKLPDGSEVGLEVEPGTALLVVRAGRSRFELATLPREDFPVMASAEYDHVFTMRAGDLARLFEKTRFAVSTEETRYYLNGVYLHPAEAEGAPVLRAVATDGHRLARIDAEQPEGAGAAPGVIVPRKTVGELGRLLEDGDALTEVAISETKIRFTTEAIVLTSKVVDGTFPDYSRVIPADNHRQLEVDARLFGHAVDRVATVSQEKSRAVKMTLDEDRLVLSVNSPDSGRAEEEMIAAYGDEAMEIGFNAKYLTEIAGQVDKENIVFFFADANSPTLVREGDDASAVYVVMPMRV